MPSLLRGLQPRRASALPDTSHRLDIPGIFMVLPEGDLEAGFAAAAAVAEVVTRDCRLYAGSQGRFVLIPGASAAEMPATLKAAKKALKRQHQPGIVVAIFGDLATWDVGWENFPTSVEAEIAEVRREIDRIRRAVAG